MKPHFRKDIFSSNWVIISDERMLRPNDYRNKNIKCPFCPGNESQTPPEIVSIKKNGIWTLRVVPNRYPALVYNKNNYLKKEGVNEKYYFKGIHEVIIEDRVHNRKIFQIKHYDEVLKIYANRIEEIYKTNGIEYVMLFRNYGINAGASLRHPHSQIVGLGIVPFRVLDEINHFKSYFDKNKRCPMCDTINNEIIDKKRVVSMSNNYIAFAPFASRFNFEIWIAPLNHIPCFTIKEDFISLKEIIFDVFKKLDRVIDDLSYNMIFHISSVKKVDSFHWHIEILPKLAMPAGFEWGSGMYINSISPETCVNYLRTGKKFKYY